MCPLQGQTQAHCACHAQLALDAATCMSMEAEPLLDAMSRSTVLHTVPKSAAAAGFSALLPKDIAMGLAGWACPAWWRTQMPAQLPLAR